MTISLLANGLMAAVLACMPGGGTNHWSAATTIMAPTPFNGINGLAFNHEGQLLAGSLFGGQLWAIDTETGATRVVIDRPLGQSDDVAISPKGGTAWASLLEGSIRYRAHEGAEVQELAQLPSINSIRYDSNSGRPYAAQVFGGDALWEIDPNGKTEPRLIVAGAGRVNGFDIGKDGMIYAP